MRPEQGFRAKLLISRNCFPRSVEVWILLVYEAVMEICVTRTYLFDFHSKVSAPGAPVWFGACEE